MSMDEKLMQRVKEGWKECCILNDSIADEAGNFRRRRKNL